MKLYDHRTSEAEEAAQPAAADFDDSPEVSEWPDDEAASAAPVLTRQSTGVVELRAWPYVLVAGQMPDAGHQ